MVFFLPCQTVFFYDFLFSYKRYVSRNAQEVLFSADEAAGKSKKADAAADGGGGDE